MKRVINIFLFLAVLLPICVAQPNRSRFKFDAAIPDVHDPVIAYCEGRYYIFSTGFGIYCMSSADFKTWKFEKSVISDIPSWTRDAVKGFRGHIWAPDIQYYKGQWYLFYSCSAFGKNTSAIGLVTNKTLNPLSPDYKWEDRGLVVQSIPGSTNWNAIDPNMAVDSKDNAWLNWGSFWDGIQLAKLIDFDKPKSLKDGNMRGLSTKPKTIARRFFSKGKNKPSEADIALANEAPNAGPNAIEAPFIIHEGDYFYLFASWDYCCKGKRSNYKTVVGRSRKVQGPYLDRNGNDMAKGGGELIAGPDEEYYGIGHCGLMKLDGKWHIVAHGYAKAYDGASKLWHRTLSFTTDGWPIVDQLNSK